MAIFVRTILILLTFGLLVIAAEGRSQDRYGSSVSGRLSDSHLSDTLVPDTMGTDTLEADTLVADSLTIEAVSEGHSLEWDDVIQDPKTAYLLRAHREAVDRQMGIPGFRIHLYMDSGNRARLNTQRQQAEFEKEYPEITSYIIYEEPYFKLRAGDFRTRLDARRFLEKIKGDYSSAYIVVDLINFPQAD